MANVLIVSQKELVTNPVFKQDKNVLELYNVLKEKHNIKILFMHRNVKIEEENINGNENGQDNNVDIKNTNFDVQQFCIRDMIKNNYLKRNLNAFIKEYDIKTIVFMSNQMAKLIMPYIESLLKDLNIICDFRLSNISHLLRQYKDEKEKDETSNFNNIYKNFKINFLQMLPILKHTSYIVLDIDTDTELLLNQNVNNIIIPEKIINYIDNKKENKDDNIKKQYKTVDISINRNNYASKKVVNFEKDENLDTYILNETNKYNLIEDINSVIKNNKSDYFCIHSNKIEILQNTINMLIDYFSFNKRHALVAPKVFYSRERNSLKSEFDNQRFNNFSNWEEAKPLSFSEFVVIKRKFFNKVGLFDTNFKTFDYALFDFILRLYQIKAYYCVMNDIVVFKPSNITRQISLFKEDANFLCKKWGESTFNMGI